MATRRRNACRAQLEHRRRVAASRAQIVLRALPTETPTHQLHASLVQSANLAHLAQHSALRVRVGGLMATRIPPLHVCRVLWVSILHRTLYRASIVLLVRRIWTVMRQLVVLRAMQVTTQLAMAPCARFVSQDWRTWT